MASNGGRCGPQWNAAQAHVANTYTHCHLCGQAVNFKLSRMHPLGWTVDHLTPVIAGGPLYAPDNLQLAHRRCNTQRGDKPLAEYRQWQTANLPTNNGPSRQWLSITS